MSYMLRDIFIEDIPISKVLFGVLAFYNPYKKIRLEDFNIRSNLEKTAFGLNRYILELLKLA